MPHLQIALKCWSNQGREAEQAMDVCVCGGGGCKQAVACQLHRKAVYLWGNALYPFLLPLGGNFLKAHLSGCLHQERNVLPKFHVSRPRSLGWAVRTLSFI